MELLAAVGGLSFVLASLVIGVRLLALASRTRELPELMCGIALVLMGGLAYPLLSVARLATGLPEPLRIGLGSCALLMNGVGAVAIAAFTWRVFRPADGWARAAVVWMAVAFGLCLILQGVTTGVRAAALHNQGAALRAFMMGLGFPLAWTAFESLRFRGLLVRRARLGLGDPVVADRMWLWGTSALAAFVLNVATSVAAFFGVDFATTVIGALMIAPLGLMAAGGMWLAFLPPASYTRRVSRRAAASEA